MGLAATVGFNMLLFLLVAGLSATVDPASFKDKFLAGPARRGLLVGLTCQYVLLPFLGFFAVKIFKVKPAVGISLLLVTSSPGGSYSNWWCSLFNADLALSIACTTVSTILSAVMLPLNLVIYLRVAYGNSVVVVWPLLLAAIGTVVAGVGCGLLMAARLNQSWRNRANLLGNISGLVLMIYSAMISSRKDPIWNRTSSFYLACSTPFLGGMLAATLVTKLLQLPKPERVAIVVETCYQNIGLAMSMSLSMYAGEEDKMSAAAGVPLFYGFLEATLIGVWCLITWQLNWTYAPRCPPQDGEDERIESNGCAGVGFVGFVRYLAFEVVMKNHQPSADDGALETSLVDDSEAGVGSPRGPGQVRRLELDPSIVWPMSSPTPPACSAHVVTNPVSTPEL